MDFMDRYPRLVHPEPNTGCWLCVSLNNKEGYARLRDEMSRGPIPSGMEVDHLCRVRCCVNPDHLEVVTPLENKQRSAAGHEVRCRNGHLRQSAGVYRHPAGSYRRCNECARLSRLRYLSKNSGAA